MGRKIGVGKLAHVGEAYRAQGRREQLGVVGRIGQHGHVPVLAVADHQRDPSLRDGALCERLRQAGNLLPGAGDRALRLAGLGPPFPVHDLLVVGERQRDVALHLVGAGAVAVGEQIVRVDAQHAAVLGDRLVELLLPGESQSAVGAGVQVARVDLDGRLEIGQRAGQIALARAREPAIVVRGVAAGVEAQLLVVVGDGAVVLSQLEQGPRTAAEERRVGRPEPDRLVEVEHGQGEHPLCHVGGGPVAKRQPPQGTRRARVDQHACAGLDPGIGTRIDDASLLVRLRGRERRKAEREQHGDNETHWSEHRYTSSAPGEAKC